MAFLETLAEAHRLSGIEGFAYSLMGNHYHLCLRTRNHGSCVTLMVYIPSDSTDSIWQPPLAQASLHGPADRSQ
jgi:hypothetical protein